MSYTYINIYIYIYVIGPHAKTGIKDFEYRGQAQAPGG